MKNITLIGMPGCGKSTIGVVLAKRLGFSFIDVDLLIQEKEKRLLMEIIEEDGLDGFLDVENRMACEISVEKAIIAPGGSIVYREEAMRHLQSTGLIVYLKISYDALELRLGDLKDRGVVLKEDMTLRDLYSEREPLYEIYADITIVEDDKDLGQIVDELRAILEEKLEITINK